MLLKQHLFSYMTCEVVFYIISGFVLVDLIIFHKVISVNF
jgi:hypothetical protein